MKVSTAMNHMKRLEGVAGEIYRSARALTYQHYQILNALDVEVYHDPAWAKLPGWARERISAKIEILAKRLYQPDMYAQDLEDALRSAAETGEIKKFPYLRWALRVDGVEVTTQEICTLRAAGDEDVWGRVEGAHVWNHAPHSAFTEWTFTSPSRAAAV